MTPNATSPAPAAIARLPRTEAASEADRFTPLELRVIGLAERTDVTREFSRRSRGVRFIEWAFGVKKDRPLADPHLESLRRFASLAFHRPERLGEADFWAFLEAGFSPGQVDKLLTYVSGRRSGQRVAGLA